MTKKHFATILIISALALALFAMQILLLYYGNKSKKISFNPPPQYRSRINSALQNFNTRPFSLLLGDEELPLDAEEKQKWVEQYARAFTMRSELRPNTDRISSYLEDLAPGINIEPLNARFIMQNGELKEYVPAVNGRNLDIIESVNRIISAMAEGRQYATLAIAETEPSINLSKLQNLGITTLIGKGSSNFAGSSGARIHNIEIGAEKLNGLLLGPGEEFSFNSNIGKINSANGYKPNLVIKGFKLVPEYGGGICQVSTTLFRAAISAGLDITERRSHSLPVRFYNPQGYDATVYQGVTDLKFANNTPSYILIQSRIIGNILEFEIYGKDDGRKVIVNRPVIYEAPGDGSLKTYFTRTITYQDGTKNTETFYSSYKSPTSFEQIRNPLE